jgi:hypothetical protein
VTLNWAQERPRAVLGLPALQHDGEAHKAGDRRPVDAAWVLQSSRQPLPWLHEGGRGRQADEASKASEEGSALHVVQYGLGLQLVGSRVVVDLGEQFAVALVGLVLAPLPSAHHADEVVVAGQPPASLVGPLPQLAGQPAP